MHGGHQRGPAGRGWYRDGTRPSAQYETFCAARLTPHVFSADVLTEAALTVGCARIEKRYMASAWKLLVYHSGLWFTAIYQSVFVWLFTASY
jgi:hypothetical protein